MSGDGDVVMADSQAVAETKTPEEIEALLYSDLRTYITQVERTSLTKETRHLNRALRYTFSKLRRRLTSDLLLKAVQEFYPSVDGRNVILEKLGKKDEMAVEETQGKEITPEVEVFLHLLVLVHLLDSKKNAEAVQHAEWILEHLMSAWNRRTLDPLSAKVYFYFSRAHELNGDFSEIRPKLLQYQRTATLRHNFDGQVVLLNLLLRNYLHYKLYDQAEKLAEKTEFLEHKAPSNEAARYYFYLGRINAVQLRYSDAFNNLQKALRKGPRDSANGWRSIVTKFSIIVQLLLGEIPERSLFRAEGIKHSLLPYFQLTQTVRSGSVNEFHEVVAKYSDLFKKDNTYLLVLRLRHTVIKTGLKKISAAYSRVSFTDISKKLNLESEVDAEYVVAKSIRDASIDATIDHTSGYIKSNDNVDVYATDEPEKAFHARIGFCLQVHNDAVKAMRYPPESWKQTKEEDDTKDLNEEDLADLLDDEDTD
eukprot:TRINITY_DN11444_c0_g1_i1.p1 TRINITY_DN11444_c0_g1~~TRINITY_DN11444_c0_g1_i1.p1  ORF type:complete len:480 (-),score=123.03 TRINITY_DN11444_c0_g1_i1:66-1505(-)